MIPKKTILPIMIILTLILPSASSAVNLNLRYPEIGGFNINDEDDQDLNKVIAWLYYFVVAIGGFSAFFMLVQAGLTYLNSGGDSSKISDARDKMSSAIIGLIIILASYLILRIINPELTTLNLPSL